MPDPTTLNPTERADQVTAFVLAPVCVRCGDGGLSMRRDGTHRCDGCHRIVTMIEYAPTILSRYPDRADSEELFRNRATARLLGREQEGA